MSRSRHISPDANDLIARSVNKLLTREFELVRDEHDRAHSHPWHQLLLPRSGMLRTRTPTDIFFVPSNRAALVPAGVVHESWALSDARFAGIYFDPDIYPENLTRCRIIEVTGFLDALIARTLEAGKANDQAHSSRQQRIFSVLMDEIAASSAVDLSVTMPADKRLQPVIQALLTRPSSSRPLSAWAQTVGASQRTISRLFLKETGMSFGRWRQKVRMVSALSLLEEGKSVQQIALNVGYSSASAFIFAFRQEFGLPPQRYLVHGSSKPSLSGRPPPEGACVGAT